MKYELGEHKREKMMLKEETHALINLEVAEPIKGYYSASKINKPRFKQK